jgi:hypothetical protein
MASEYDSITKCVKLTLAPASALELSGFLHNQA